MQKLQMVDLKRQYAKIKDQVDAAIQQVIDDTAFINGKPVQPVSYTHLTLPTTSRV